MLILSLMLIYEERKIPLSVVSTIVCILYLEKVSQTYDKHQIYILPFLNKISFPLCKDNCVVFFNLQKLLSQDMVQKQEHFQGIPTKVPVIV